jgi:hypothetical protein
MSPPLPVPDQPQSGYMRLFDAAVPPLRDGSYRLTVSANVAQQSTPAHHDNLLDETLDRQRYFTVEGPRFTMDPGLVAGVFPPQGAHGPFADSLPQIVLNRRTLPWERAIGPTLAQEGLPWMAVLLFADGEATFLPQQPLESVLPQGVIHAPPSGIRCDALEVRRSLLADVMPSVEELELLAHVRQVNIEDRELNVSRGDGFFSVVIGNRLPTPNVKHRAYLVSLEGRADLVPAKSPPVVDFVLDNAISLEEVALNLGREVPGGSDVTAAGAAAAPATVVRPIGDLPILIEGVIDPTVRLVCLYSWQFTCEGDASFEQLMQGLDVGMFGAVEGGQPAVSDSGHVATELHDRAGETQTAWYRSPLVPYALSRDDQGPYHSADQARRVSPDTGMEDITYSAAFELGRLLAVADGRLAQELMRWRRQGYSASALADVASAIGAMLPGLDPTLTAHLTTAMVPVVSTGVATRVAPHLGPIADAAGLDPVGRAPGLDAARLSVAWDLVGAGEAAAVLAGTAGVPALGDGVTGPADLAAAAADTAGQTRLAEARAQALENARTSLEGAP